MRIVFVFLGVVISFLYCTPIKAEYNGHFIDFNIELKNGAIIAGHSYVSSIEYMVDSGTYQNYLESRLDVLLGQGYETPNDYVYHEYRLSYTFPVPKFDSGTIFTLVGKKSISKEAVKRIEITKMIDFTYAIIVVNPLTKRDERWMENPSVGFENVWDKLNTYDIFIHEKNKELDLILLEIEQETKEYEKRIKALEIEIENMDGYDRQGLEEQLDKLEEDRMYQVSDSLSRLFPFKVVIIGYLSC